MDFLRELCWFFVVGPGVEAAKQRKQQVTEVSINNNCSIDDNNCTIDGCNAMRYEADILFEAQTKRGTQRRNSARRKLVGEEKE